MTKRLSQFNVPFQEIIIAFFNNRTTLIPANHECDKLLFPHPYAASQRISNHSDLKRGTSTDFRITWREVTQSEFIYLFIYLLFSHNKDYTSITLYKDVARGPQKTTRLVRGGPLVTIILSNRTITTHNNGQYKTHYRYWQLTMVFIFPLKLQTPLSYLRSQGVTVKLLTRGSIYIKQLSYSYSFTWHSYARKRC